MTWADLWAQLPDIYSYIARDKNHSWWAYESMPYIDEEGECWVNPSEKTSARRLEALLTTELEIEFAIMLDSFEYWKESLVKRSGLQLEKVFDL